MFFYLLFAFLICQRLIELVIARRNAAWMMKRGAKEYGKSHYKFMVLMHAGFFLSLLAEVIGLDKKMNVFWPFLLILFLVLQVARIWVIVSLGKYWNTRIIVLKDAQVVRKGPFKWFKHPNYLIVTLELIVIPLLFNAYLTAVLFFVLNQWMLSVRIPVEEKALRSDTEYAIHFDNR